MNDGKRAKGIIKKTRKDLNIMILNYNNKNYEVAELKEVNENESFDQIVIFEIEYKIYYNILNDFVKISHKRYTQEQQRGQSDLFEDKKFIGWYFGTYDEKTTIETIEIYLKKRKKAVK